METPTLAANKKTVSRRLLYLRACFQRDRLASHYSSDEPPLRSELFSADQMEQHGRNLASSHTLSAHRANNHLLTRLAKNERVLIEVSQLLTTAATANHRVTPAGEWLLDNFYLIQEQTRTAKRHLPQDYSRELPCLARGPSAGLPRVYDIALEAISHGDGRVDPGSLRRFVAAYQTVTTLKLGELWAIPIMLRLALIENLRRVAIQIATNRIDQNHANRWADQMSEIAARDPKSLFLMTADMARSNPPMTTSFVSELVRRLQGQGPALALPLTWVEQRLSESGVTIEQLVQSETQYQAADQVSISNSIGSLRFLGTMDWREFVEAMSVVEQTLRQDPASAYSAMDFTTRDRYRHVVEKIAKDSHLSEAEVAQAVIHLAGRDHEISPGTDGRTAHVGYYLIGKGLRLLESAVPARRSIAAVWRRLLHRSPLPLYLGAIASLTALFTGILAVQAAEANLPGWGLALTVLAALLGTSQLAIALVNWLATLVKAPQTLPRMDFSHGIPPAARTLVVVPCMLTGTQVIDELVEALEIRFLANRDDNLYFGLLTDFPDAQEETLPDDSALLQQVQKSVEGLNEKYPGSRGDAFFLFHRPRRANSYEQVWMGYERKRGKLADLNLLLRGKANDRFSLIVGNTQHLSSIKYVITLDTDTQLPRDAARQFAGAMAHPLNRAHFDATRQCIDDGYGILQPRVEVSLLSANRSRYARLQGGESGIDPYTRAVSDIYQDLFEEGSFIGKGIYDVDAFEQALNSRFPENRILSHDLLEGCYARAGRLSDVMLYEEQPARYSADVSRRQRWIRGDWQIACWLLPNVPGLAPHSRLKNPLSALSRWKLFDNLRRSLAPAALLFLFLLGWTVLAPAWFWTLTTLAIVLIPPLIASVSELFQKPVDILPGQHLIASVRATRRHFSQALFTLACLPYEAIFSLEAIMRTIGRMLITLKGLLEWRPADEANRDSGLNFTSSFLTMWSAPVIALVTALALALWAPAVLMVAGPLLLLWTVSPAITCWLSRPLTRRPAKLTAGQTVFLRKISRRTWAFFETFVGPGDHWLPPDNFQEHPLGVVAHRTSPTNMGLALLANLSAHDFGYIGVAQLIERTSNTIDTMDSMERFHGHFYNWYDTLSLKPLKPLYVSSVDSGNLAGHLLVLRMGLLALPDQNILGTRWAEGLRDTFDVLLETAGEITSPALVQLEADIDLACSSPPATPAQAQLLLERLTISATQAVHDMGNETVAEAKLWAETLARQCQVLLDELLFIAPWITALLADHNGLGGPGLPTLREVAKLAEAPPPVSTASAGGTTTAGQREWQQSVAPQLLEAGRRARERITAIETLASRCAELARLEYDFLYDPARHLLTIGYNVDECRRDDSYYDLLASEARFSTFVAIAQGQLPQESWFALGRPFTAASGTPLLLSWSGSMFEYLMPLLVMPAYEGSLLDQTCRAAVQKQIEYGEQRSVPWGISESGYNATDVYLNYQYRAFGVPGLGFKRGLAEDLVVAPYASALALLVAPEAACLNLQRLSTLGLLGKFGFYEAIDYTPSRVKRGQSGTVVRSFMTHHQGMSLLSLACLLLDRPMQKRFESDPSFQATALLLQERIPRATANSLHDVQLSAMHSAPEDQALPVRTFNSPNTPITEVQLLSNGRYHVMITNAGGGYSRWKDLAVTRWREDASGDSGGTFCFVRDVASGACWSGAYQPTLNPPKQYESIFPEGRAEFRRRDIAGTGEIDTHTEIAVSPEDDIELRRVHITNRSRTRRTLDVTSYAEVVLATAAEEALHPAFSNLFVQTEIIPAHQAILCTRRPRSRQEATPWMFHLMAVHKTSTEEISYETDRAQFIGRGNSIADPQALRSTAPLSGTQGSVLDPIVAIRCRIVLDPDESAIIDIVSGVGDTRELALNLVEKYHDRRIADRVFDLALTHNQVTLRQINATEADAQLYGRLANFIVHANAGLRANSSVLVRNRRGQSGLWGYAISGDLPIVLVQIESPENIDLVRQLVQAHAYWRLKGLAVDLVIWNEDHAGYRQLLHEQIMGLIAAGMEANVVDRPGGIFVRPGEQISNEDRILLQTVARAIISDNRGTLAEQLDYRSPPELRVARLVPTRAPRTETEKKPIEPAAQDRLLFANGHGGFTPDGREYVITTSHSHRTPAPWANVLANSQFGCVISESGLGYTWSENSHEFRLTPWHNDPVSDISGEAIYLRDEELGQFWSPTPLPCRGATNYVTRHGFGYSVFEHLEHGIRSELWVYVALDAAIKFSVLKVRNESGRQRRLSATGYVEWVLGDLRPKSAMHVITEIDPSSGALFARNSYNTEFPERVAFFDVSERNHTFSGDRTEFIGRNGTLKNPAAMTRVQLSGRTGAAFDPCGAIQVPFDLAVGQEREIRFTLGAGRNAADASSLVRQFREPAAARTALEKVRHYWTYTLSAVQIETPDKSINVLTNGWLLYQTLACRLWARSGYYQSGGAFGYRDQLQDAMALVHVEPQKLRAQVLLCASRQFVEGDVQHWWHPPAGRGVRTHCSDDYLWLPLAACRYVQTTGDYGILDQPVQFLEGRSVNADEDSYYDLPSQSGYSASLYEHCVRACLWGLRFGEHGLPLMGSGDWNDGMNLVGIQGKGESVWLGFFLYEVLRRFSTVADQRGDATFADRCRHAAEQLRQNIEQHGWDGEWYRRAYFDDGSMLGSAANTECQIDSIAQSWSVLSGAGDQQRRRLAMASLDRRLVRRDRALIQLLDPPFDKSLSNPGYIKGYVPGVRENGGQYTQAAIWASMAFAALGDGWRAYELLNMINPVNHGSTAANIAVYKVEPYVMAADVYGVAPHTGRGGWTWYTGSAGWMYRLIVESLLGLRLDVDKLHIAPCLPANWPDTKIRYRYRETFYNIVIVLAHEGEASVMVDGVESPDGIIPLNDDRLEHAVQVKLMALPAKLAPHAPSSQATEPTSLANHP